LDVLSGGRLRLGVGVGWNSVEYVALNENFHNRGKRIEEQIELLRLLWTQPLVTFSGRWHHVPDAGLNPLPIQRPIPIWFGGHSDPVLRRAARIGDGWLPNYRTLAEASPHFEQMEAYLRENGRSREGFGIEVRIHYGEGNPDVWRALQADWRGAGATNCSLNTMGAGFSTPEAHMRAIQRYAEESGLL
jgi:alkanesulfonate monooxygenase SsuD/methylene tetrahydromethanopterin reductase-like flavin-dependent oxidoreductase (luciferase family)